MQQQGYSLLELITVMAVAAITISMGVPSFRDLIQNNRITGITNELLVSIAQARAEAIRQNVRVRVCTSANPQAPAPACAAGNDWSGGWAVLADTAGDGTFSTKIAASQISGQVEVQAGLNAITFRGDGLSEGFNNTTFGICDSRKGDAQHIEDMRNVVLSTAGRARVEIPHAAGDLGC